MTAGPDTAMVLCAGLGTRMLPLTDRLPKPLISVAGKPLLDHALAHCRRAHVRRAVVNLHYRGDQIRAHLAGVADPEIRFSDETAELLDTGGGIKHALSHLGNRPFFTLNPDAIWTGPTPLVQLAEAWRTHGVEDGSAALLLLVPTSRAANYSRAGDFFLEGARPVRRGTRAEAPYVYTGAQILSPAAFDGCPDGPFSLNLVWDRLLASARVRAIVHDGRWVDVGTPDGIAAAGAELAAAREREA